MNMAIYIRYAEGCPGLDIEEQRTACHKYASAHGHTIFGEYIDCSTDGADGGRSAFAKMIRDSRKRRFEEFLFIVQTDSLGMYTNLLPINSA